MPAVSGIVACSDDATAHGGEVHMLSESRVHQAEGRRIRETTHGAIRRMVVVVAEVQFVDAKAILVVVEHHVKMPLDLGKRTSNGRLGDVSSRPDRVVDSKNGGKMLAAMAADRQETGE
jgi:citrate lyase gamma subunit